MRKLILAAALLITIATAAFAEKRIKVTIDGYGTDGNLTYTTSYLMEDGATVPDNARLDTKEFVEYVKSCDVTPKFVWPNIIIGRTEKFGFEYSVTYTFVE